MEEKEASEGMQEFKVTWKNKTKIIYVPSGSYRCFLEALTSRFKKLKDHLMDGDALIIFLVTDDETLQISSEEAYISLFPPGSP